MITQSVSEARRNLGRLIDLARSGEDVVIIKDSRPVAQLRAIDDADLELTTRVSDHQAQRLLEMAETGPRKTFRSGAAAVRHLRREVARRR